MITAPDLILIAKALDAVCTEQTQIVWVKEYQEWHALKNLQPSVLDAVVLANARYTGPSYQDAVLAATGWSLETYLGFQTIMLIGQPVESGAMSRDNIRYWNGIIMGLFVYEKIKKRYS